MIDRKKLSGCVVLVVEDEYYIASDTAAALKGAGAVVLGPCPNQDETMRVLGEFKPSHAILDLNLDGQGPSFELARELQAQGVPSIFVTGYDETVVPKDLASTRCLQKPVTYGEVVSALSAHVGSSASPHVIALRRMTSTL